ncbi:MAG TPA: hypothetical protein PKD10_05165, partial [Paracoccaceae bacterium]|nr:hypothetical protein [Paracoccaceae bacterium]
MCLPGLFAALGGAGAAGATAAGATAGAGLTTAQVLTNIGTVIGAGGALIQGVQAARSVREQSAALAQQAATERQLTAVQDQRTRARFMTAIRQQAAELAGRGVTLDSPTAVLLGQTAAQELAFESQAVRATGDARQRELSAAQRQLRAQRASGLMKGVFGAAETVLTAAPDLWPG